MYGVCGRVKVVKVFDHLKAAPSLHSLLVLFLSCCCGWLPSLSSFFGPQERAWRTPGWTERLNLRLFFSFPPVPAGGKSQPGAQPLFSSPAAKSVRGKWALIGAQRRQAVPR